MAIAFDNSGNHVDVSTANPTFSFTTGSISNGVMSILVFNDNGVPPTSASYNGVGATQIASIADGTVSYCSSAWILVAPTAGSNTISVQYPGTPGTSLISVSTWAGVDQATPNRAAFTSNAGGLSVSIAVTNAQNNDVVLDGVMAYRLGMTIGGGQTVLVNNNSIAGGSACACNTWVLATGSTTMTETLALGGFWADVGFALIPSGGAAAPVFAAWPQTRPVFGF